MIPKTLPTVDGSERTLTWVDVVPTTGAAVGWGRGGSGVCDGAGVEEAGKVKVVNAGVDVVNPSGVGPAPHPAPIRTRIEIEKRRVLDATRSYLKGAE